MMPDPKVFPGCQLINTGSAIWCDCGYVFDPDAARKVAASNSADRFDHAVHGLLICPKCGLINPPNAERCDCRYRFIYPSDDPSQSSRQDGATVIVECPSCARILRLAEPIEQRQFKCPTCGCQFQARWSNAGRLSIEVICDITELSAYYKVLGVVPGAKLEDLRKAYLILQRTFTQLIEPCDAALPMGDIGRAVPLLPVDDDFQHRLGVECTPGQDAAQQHLYLGDGQARGFF